MNITQALKKIQNTDNKCRRATWDQETYLTSEDEIAELAIEDLISDDWEVEEMKPSLCSEKLDEISQQTLEYLDDWSILSDHEQFIIEVALKAFKSNLLKYIDNE